MINTIENIYKIILIETGVSKTDTIIKKDMHKYAILNLNSSDKNALLKKIFLFWLYVLYSLRASIVP